MANIIYSVVHCLRCVFYASKLFFCVCKLRWASSSSFQFFTHTFSVPTFENCIDWNKLKLDCVTYWLGFELREQKSILFILLLLKKTNPNNERFEAKYKIFLVCSFLLSRSPTVKEARRNRRWQSTTKNLSSVRFFFSILHSLENYFHISRKISHSHIFYALSYHCSADVQNKTKL